MRAGPDGHYCTDPRCLACEHCGVMARGEGRSWARQDGVRGLLERPSLASLPILCSLQTDKEQLTAEAKELRQKVKYLQDQLSPLTRQREYQEKEIQRLNKVGVLARVPWLGRAPLSPAAMPTPSLAPPTIQLRKGNPQSVNWHPVSRLLCHCLPHSE